MEEVISGVTLLNDQGVKELVLTGIHLGQYGADLSPAATLVSLLEILLQTHPHLYFRIKFAGTPGSHPCPARPV